MKSLKSSVSSQAQKNGARKDKIEEKSTIKVEVSLDDPLSSVVTLLDRKIRSLEKRKSKSISLQQLSKEGKNLNEDQLATASQLPEILVRIDFVKELQEQLTLMHEEYVKRKQCLPESILDPASSARTDAVNCLTTAMDVISNVQLYVEKLTIINSGSDEPLSKTDLNTVVKFKRLIESSPKRTQFHYHNLVSRMDKMINKDINLTYASLMELILKIHHHTQLNNVSSKDANNKKTEKPQAHKTNGHAVVDTEPVLDSCKDHVEQQLPIDMIEIVEKTENLDIWQDCNSKSSEKKSMKVKKAERGTASNQRYRQTGAPRGRRDNRNFPNDEVHRVTVEGTHIVVRDVSRDNGRGRDENFRGYRGNKSHFRRSDDGDSSRPTNGDQAQSSTDGNSRRGNYDRPRSSYNRRVNFRGDGNFRGRFRDSQEPAPVVY